MIAIGLFVFYCFCVNDTATTEIYTLSLHDALPILMLERIGYRADVAADGLEALEALSRVPYASVLMDIHMPRSEEHTSELQSRQYIVCRLLLEKKRLKKKTQNTLYNNIVVIRSLRL